MIKALIIDDEKDAIDLLKIELNQNFKEVEVVDVAYGAKEGLLKIAELKPELIFLDIDMPWMNGLELVRVIPSGQTDVIFVTAHNELAIKAIRTSALDFLTKPVNTEDLRSAIDRYKEKNKTSNNTTQIEFLLNQLEAYKNNDVKQIALPTQKGISYINLNDIIFCKADDIYVNIYLSNNKKYFVSRQLKELEALLEKEKFYRCHKSYIVNLKKIELYSKNEGDYLTMVDGNKIPLSRSKKIEFQEMMKTQ